jgi:hypothetical protein
MTMLLASKELAKSLQLELRLNSAEREREEVKLVGTLFSHELYVSP